MRQLWREIPGLVMDRGPAGNAVRVLLPVAGLLLGLLAVIVWGGHRIGMLGLTGAVALFGAGNAAIIVFAVLWLAQRVRVEAMIRRKIEDEARAGGLHDALTGLANRGYFLDQLGRRLALAERQSLAPFAVFCLSVEGLGETSRRLGQATGDRVVVKVADVIRECVRATDLVAKLGGDEFAILIEELAAPRDSSILAQRLLAAIPQAVAQISADIVVTANIGIAFKGPHHLQAGDLLREADSALRLAKSSGDGRYQLTA
jgi:diguanylate cyclase (GGDEF)-like protein